MSAARALAASLIVTQNDQLAGVGLVSQCLGNCRRGDICIGRGGQRGGVSQVRLCLRLHSGRGGCIGGQLECIGIRAVGRLRRSRCCCCGCVCGPGQGEGIGAIGNGLQGGGLGRVGIPGNGQCIGIGHCGGGIGLRQGSVGCLCARLCLGRCRIVGQGRLRMGARLRRRRHRAGSCGIICLGRLQGQQGSGCLNLCNGRGGIGSVRCRCCRGGIHGIQGCGGCGGIVVDCRLGLGQRKGCLGGGCRGCSVVRLGG